jgi:hypothetical protein
MTRLCERPGCSQVAEMTYGFDADHLMVWIDSYERVTNDRAGVLCRRHADAMVVPLGWMLDDRRDPVPRLFKTPATQTATPTRHRRAPSQHRSAAEQLRLDAEAVIDAVAEIELPVEVPVQVAMEVEVAAEAPEAAELGVDVEGDVDADVLPWKPTFDQTDDLDGLLEARSPLLARAFGGQGRRPADD